MFNLIDAYTSSHCYRIFLTGADVTISYEDEDNPLIAVSFLRITGANPSPRSQNRTIITHI